MKGNIRVILYAAAFGIAFLLWNKWQIANQPKVPPSTHIEQTNQAPSAAVDTGIPSAAGTESSENFPAPTSLPNHQDNQNHSVVVETDVLRLFINLNGGTVTKAELLKYPATLKSKEPLALMHTNNPGRLILQTSLASQNKSPVPTNNSLFSAAETKYTMTEGQNKLEVPLQWKSDDGVVITKTFIFERDKYAFTVQQTIQNNSTQVWQGYPYEQLDFGTSSASGGLGHVYTFTGGVMSTPDSRYEKIKLADFATNIEKSTDSGWVAMIQHYFLAAIIPPSGQKSTFYTRDNNGNHILGVVGQSYTVEPGKSAVMSLESYVGPKVQSRLQAIAPALDKTVDYGWLFMISQPMFYVLKFIHGLIGNWGWAIIIMTLLIKVLFFTPSAWAYKSMAKMRRLQPQMTRLKERYGDDRQAMSQAMMQLYRDEKVNPASGCLPMLLQIPFFIAFYWVLVESVELRQAPWILWIHDLAAMDPYFILPIINAALMFLQQKLNPPPPDPMQAKVMMTLPLVFGFMFMWFPSGLVLYWTVSNAFSIVQQYIMNKRYGTPHLQGIHQAKS